MRVFLMYPGQDFELKQPLPPNAADLIQDLELNILFEEMAQEDEFLEGVARQAVLSSLDDPAPIRYRQEILADCLKNPAVVREIYQITIQSIKNKQKHWMGIFSRYPSAILSGGVQMLEMFVGLLRHLKQLADEHGGEFESEGFQRFFGMVQRELDDEYFSEVETTLRELKFREGVLLSGEVGRGNEGTNYTLRKPRRGDLNWIQRFLPRKSRVYSFSIHPRDDHGARALEELKDRGINQVANVVAQSADHIDSFLKTLRLELAFYIGCLNLSGQLARLGEPLTFPQPAVDSERSQTFSGLYDISLALIMNQRVVGNDLEADGKDLVMITGANQGGKSTFLRSIGQAQLMLQCGMFVAAETFSANLCRGLFTHYKREEDASMKSGKLDEELGRMSSIVGNISSNCMVLFNESFAATNEREGSEIARQVVSALLEKQIKVFFVTHQFEFAHDFFDQDLENAVFLRAERLPDGERTFKLIPGEPLQTSYGADLYKKIFGASS